MQVNTAGKVFEDALGAVSPKLDGKGKREVRENAAALLKQIILAFEKTYGADPLGSDWKREGKEPTGLVYGRIQSGKTRAMITTTAMAFDNGFKIVIVLTSNNNRLTDQTHKDFQRGLPGIKVLCKRDLKKDRLELEQEHIERLLRRDGGPGIVVVTSKNSKSLSDIATFLKKVNADVLPAIVFDDEGDEASLDTNTRRRSNGEEIAASRIHELIHGQASVRDTLFYELFVSVTGTPQAILLQSKNSAYDVVFKELLRTGSDYTGGETFFPDPDPKNSSHVVVVDSEEKFVLLDESQDIPTGLKNAICFFLLAAVGAYKKNGWEEYKLLCHPSVKQNDHVIVRKQIAAYIANIIDHLCEKKPNPELDECFAKQYEELKKTAKKLPPLREMLAIVSEHITQREIFTINAKTTDDDFVYSPHFNFLIGGNSIGRGLAIKNLLITYYVREPKIANMDTMYQHARMFGYRRKTIDFTRVYLPYQLYARFRSIYESDEKTREFIATSTDAESPLTIEVDVTQLRPTRANVIDANAVATVLPGTQLYPDRPIYKRAEARLVRAKTLRKLKVIFPTYEHDGSTGRDISPEEAVTLLRGIRTDAANAWSDKMVRDQLRSIAQSNGGKVRLFYREARRRAGTELGGRRVLPTGVLSGDEFQASQNVGYPVLWIFDVGAEVKKDWDKNEFVYPTVIFPKSMKAFVFNKR